MVSEDVISWGFSILVFCILSAFLIEKITPLALVGWEIIMADSVLSVSLAISVPSHIQPHTIKAALSNRVHCAVPGLEMAKLNDFRPSEDFILLLQTSAPSATGMNSNSKLGFDFLKRWTDNKKLKFNTAKILILSGRCPITTVAFLWIEKLFSIFLKR